MLAFAAARVVCGRVPPRDELRLPSALVGFGGSASGVEQNGYPLGSLSSCAHIAACVVAPCWSLPVRSVSAAASSGIGGAWCSVCDHILVSPPAKVCEHGGALRMVPSRLRS